jgi:hypothetical protein
VLLLVLIIDITRLRFGLISKIEQETRYGPGDHGFVTQDLFPCNDGLVKATKFNKGDPQQFTALTGDGIWTRSGPNQVPGFETSAAPVMMSCQERQPSGGRNSWHAL